MSGTVPIPPPRTRVPSNKLGHDSQLVRNQTCQEQEQEEEEESAAYAGIVDDPTTFPNFTLSCYSEIESADELTCHELCDEDEEEKGDEEGDAETSDKDLSEASEGSTSSSSSSVAVWKTPVRPKGSQETLTVAVVLENLTGDLLSTDRMPRAAKKIVLSREEIQRFSSRSRSKSRSGDNMKRFGVFLLTKTLSEDHLETLSEVDIEVSIFDRNFEDWIVLESTSDIVNFAKLRISLIASHSNTKSDKSTSSEDQQDSTSDGIVLTKQKAALSRSKSSKTSLSSILKHGDDPKDGGGGDDDEENHGFEDDVLMDDDDLVQLAARMQDPKTGVSIKDRRYLMRVYKRCFIGQEGVTWLVNHLGLSSREEGVRVGQLLLQSFLISHVCYDHSFKDKYLFYSFCKGGEKVPLPSDISERLNPELIESVERIAVEMAAFESGLQLKKRRWKLKSYENCFTGEEAITWMSMVLGITRNSGVSLGNLMIEKGYVVHVTNSRPFLDEPHLYIFSPKLLSIQRNNPDTGVCLAEGSKKEVVRTISSSKARPLPKIVARSTSDHPDASPSTSLSLLSSSSSSSSSHLSSQQVIEGTERDDNRPRRRSFLSNMMPWSTALSPSSSSSSSSSALPCPSLESPPSPPTFSSAPFRPPQLSKRSFLSSITGRKDTFKVSLNLPKSIPNEREGGRAHKIKAVKIAREGFVYAIFEDSGSITVHTIESDYKEHVFNESPISVIHHEYPWIASYHTNHSIQLYNIQTGVGKRFGFYASELVRAPQAIVLDEDHLVALSPDEMTIWKINVSSPRPLKKIDLSSGDKIFQSLSSERCQLRRNHILLSDRWNFQMWNWVDEKIILSGESEKQATRTLQFFHIAMCYDSLITVSAKDFKIWKIPSDPPKQGESDQPPIKVSVGTFVTCLFVDYSFIITGTKDGDVVVYRRKNGELLYKLNDPLASSVEKTKKHSGNGEGDDDDGDDDETKDDDDESVNEHSMVSEMKRNAIFAVLFLSFLYHIKAFSSFCLGLSMLLLMNLMMYRSKRSENS